jgi:hypothetical protein
LRDIDLAACALERHADKLEDIPAVVDDQNRRLPFHCVCRSRERLSTISASAASRLAPAAAAGGGPSPSLAACATNRLSMAPA